MNFTEAPLKNELQKFVENIARLHAHGDRTKDGSEVIWDDSYAQSQLWEIIYNARLLSGACPHDASAFYEPRQRPFTHSSCVRTYPDRAQPE